MLSTVGVVVVAVAISVAVVLIEEHELSDFKLLQAKFSCNRRLGAYPSSVFDVIYMNYQIGFCLLT